jgi:serine/threonine protein kinase
MDGFLSLYEESEDYEEGVTVSSPLCDQLPITADEYSQEVLIATGGMKKIYKVFCNSTHRYIAKACLNDPSKVELRDAFIREARLTALLDHPNIIKIYQIALSKAREPFFTMELKTGASLEAFLQKEDDRNILLGIFIKICDAIAYAHSRRVLHLDLKPDNIQVGSFGEVIVCDWGLGKIITRKEAGEETSSFELEADMLNHCTMYGEAKGTPAYMAPEQLKGATKDERTDIYSLGAMLYTILNPERLKGKNLDQRLEESRSGVLTDLDQSDLPVSLKSVVAKAMALRSIDRYSSVEDLKNDVQRFLNYYPTMAQEAGIITQLSYLWRRNKYVSSILVGSFFIIIISLLFFLKEIKESERNTLLALEKSERYADVLEKTLKENQSLEESIKYIPKKIVDRIFSDNQKYRDYQLLMTPKVSLERSNQYLKAAYETAPDDIYLIKALVANYFIAMDFAGFANFHKKHADQLPFYAPFIENNLKGRDLDKIEPNFEDFKAMVSFCERLPVLMELVIAYNADRFQKNSEFTKLISSLIYHYYPENGKVEISLKDYTLDLWGPQLKYMTSPITQLSLLRYLDFKDLFVADNSIMDAKEFAGLNLRSLHLQHTPIKDLSPLLGLPSLDHVTIIDGQIPKEQLESFSRRFSKDLVEIYAASEADFSGGVKTNYNHINYTANKFLDGFFMNLNGKVSFKLKSEKAGEELLTIRYSAGHNDAIVLFSVNGVEQEIILKSTKSWTQWAIHTLPVTMKQGENIISLRMKLKTKHCFNLDYLSRKISK